MEDRTYNAYTYYNWDQSPTEGWSLHEGEQDLRTTPLMGMFVNPTYPDGDYRLKGGSPLAGAGKNVQTILNDLAIIAKFPEYDFTKDLAGNPWNSNPSIGCYEYGSFFPNQPPVANAGPDRTITDKDKDGSEQVTLDGSASSDPDGTIVSFVWTEGAAQIATGAKPTVTLSTGTHAITLTVTDNGGLTDTDTVTIKVVKEDKEFGELPTGCYNNVINPLKGEKATIIVEIKERCHIKIDLYDRKGNKIKKIADEEREADTHEYYWDGKDDSNNIVGSGLYFVHIEAGDYKKTKKILVVK